MRISSDMVSRRRNSRETTFFLTGGTGFIGSHLACELLKNDHNVILLARPHKGLSARDRVDRILDWFELGQEHRRNLAVVEGLLDMPHFGLDGSTLDRILHDVDEIIHCASDTSFSERKRSAVEKANVDAMGNMLRFAASGRCYFFHYVSTAYAAGRRTGICKEDLVDNDSFTNVYEDTKCQAEKISWMRCQEEGIRLSIYRPSIVYGNSKTGRSTIFNAVYYPVRTVLFLKELYEADIRERGGHKAHELGVRLGADGSLYLPIRVEVSENGGINLIPIDYFISAFMAIVEDCTEGGIFHIVNERLKRVDDIIDYTKRLFNICGIEACRPDEFTGAPKNALEMIFDKYLEAYGPYIRDTRVFESRNAQYILSKRNIVCPDFDFEVFSRCVKYAIEQRWGSGLFKGAT